MTVALCCSALKGETDEDKKKTTFIINICFFCNPDVIDHTTSPCSKSNLPCSTSLFLNDDPLTSKQVQNPRLVIQTECFTPKSCSSCQSPEKCQNCSHAEKLSNCVTLPGDPLCTGVVWSEWWRSKLALRGEHQKHCLNLGPIISAPAAKGNFSTSTHNSLHLQGFWRHTGFMPLLNSDRVSSSFVPFSDKAHLVCLPHPCLLH